MEDSGWKAKLNQYKIPIGLSVVGMVLIAGGVFASGLDKAKPKVPSTSSGQGFPKESLVQGQKLIAVDVSGAVVRPGVYQLKEGVRIEEAISAAGGFAESANQEFISKYLNLAQKISDGSKVYIPATGENMASSQTGTVAGAGIQAKVNINTAAQAELEALSGIGPVTASKIISGRPYQQIEELLNKKMVSKAVFEKIKEQLVVY